MVSQQFEVFRHFYGRNENEFVVGVLIKVVALDSPEVHTVVGSLKVANIFLKHTAVQYLVGCGPFALVHSQTGADDEFQVRRVHIRDFLILSFLHFLIQPVHIFGFKGRLQHGQLVSHASQGPYVALRIVGLVSPHLGRRVVRSAGLSVNESHLCNFTHIHVPQLVHIVLRQKYVGTLQVPVQDAVRVQHTQRLENVVKQQPNVLFRRKHVLVL